ncbi:hypothetical protein QYF36_006616 [Acer negundo]|nr:hypothetical protein QYF36_006616 [Acer negundo]
MGRYMPIKTFMGTDTSINGAARQKAIRKVVNIGVIIAISNDKHLEDLRMNEKDISRGNQGKKEKLEEGKFESSIEKRSKNGGLRKDDGGDRDEGSG